MAIAIAAIQAKHENEMLSLREIIKKSLLLRESLSTTPPPNTDTTSKSIFGSDFLPKTSIERQNQGDLGYFDPYFDRAHGEG